MSKIVDTDTFNFCNSSFESLTLVIVSIMLNDTDNGLLLGILALVQNSKTICFHI